MASEKILQRFGKYFLFDRTAEGGMAEVFRARKVSEGGEGRLFVVKRIRPEVANQAGFKEMFVSEARVLTRLSHPNVVQLHEFGEEDGLPYLVMEYLQGRTLGEILIYLRKMSFRLPLEFVIGITEQVARALNYAHMLRDPMTGDWLGVVHRDITPENIFVCWDGSVKLIDFGIVKATTNVERTQTGFMKGKPAYLSPEYLTGDPVDGRADIFALGAVIWEMVAGKRLFLAQTDPQTVRNVLELQPPPLVKFNPETPPELEDIVCKSLEKDPMHRYRTAEELERQVHGLLVRVARNFVPSDLGSWVLKIFRGEVEEDTQRLRELDSEFRNTREGTGSISLSQAQTGPELPPPPKGDPRFVVPPPFEPGRRSLTAAESQKSSTETSFALPGASAAGSAAAPIPSAPAPVPSLPTAPAGLTRPPEPVIDAATYLRTPVPSAISLGLGNVPPPPEPASAPASPWKWMVIGGLLVGGVMWGTRHWGARSSAERPAETATPTPSAAPSAKPAVAENAVPDESESADEAEPEESQAPPARAPLPRTKAPKPAAPARAAPVAKSTTVATAKTKGGVPPTLQPIKGKMIPLRIHVMPEGETFTAWINEVQLNPKKPEALVPFDQITKVVVKSPGYKTFQLKVVPDSEVLGDAPYWLMNVRLQQKRN